jgi:uncharacterized Zn-finger protein
MHTHRTAFECPYEGCGRKFSVHSNMHRHASTHTQESAFRYDYRRTTTQSSDEASESGSQADESGNRKIPVDDHMHHTGRKREQRSFLSLAGTAG